MSKLEPLLPLLLSHKITVTEAAERTHLSKRYIYKTIRQHASEKRSLAQKRKSLLDELQRIELALAHQAT
ncbi:hypothetical protein [Pseudoalteromonas pernae]|uniref:hypothetical protein n=1 Tax=Pseudoalteromonas pernae TaxID=3118054 RepID=UPI0032424115